MFTFFPARLAGLPDFYAPSMSPDMFYEQAKRAMYIAQTTGFSPIAASVTGSRLRGTDHDGSDIDILVVVADKLVHGTHSIAGEDDVTIVSLDSFTSKLSRSVPFVEFLRSPYLVCDSAWAHFFDSVRPDFHAPACAAQKLTGSYTRSNKKIGKKVRGIISCYHFARTGSPLCPRNWAVMNYSAREIIEFADIDPTSEYAREIFRACS